MQSRPAETTKNVGSAASGHAPWFTHPGGILTTAHEVRAAIEVALKSRTAPPGTRASRIEESMKGKLSDAWKMAKRHPSLGVLAATGVGLAAVELLGVGEIAVGVAFGYAAYQVLRKGMPLSEAIEKAEHLIR
jgi:hypothetical protein